MVMGHQGIKIGAVSSGISAAVALIETH
jgi:hypothetical protein